MVPSSAAASSRVAALAGPQSWAAALASPCRQVGLLPYPRPHLDATPWGLARRLGTHMTLTLLWTSQGLVMADRSHAVIIMALWANGAPGVPSLASLPAPPLQGLVSLGAQSQAPVSAVVGVPPCAPLQPSPVTPGRQG